LKGRGKLSYLLGTGPKKGDSTFEAWDEENSMVMSWLRNSMLLEISDTVMFLSTAQEIWDAIKQTYSKVRDATQIYEIKTKILATKSRNQSIIEYSNLLQTLWKEMDHYQCIQMKCSEHATLLKRFVEKDGIYELLVGLNIEFDGVRGQILGKEDLPSLNETITIVYATEGRRGVILETPTEDGSTLMTRRVTMKHPSLEQQSGEVRKAKRWISVKQRLLMVYVL